MRYYYKKTNMICFDQEELKQIFEAPSRKCLEEEVEKSGYSNYDLMQDCEKMIEIASKIKIIKDKEDLEIFSALYIFPIFYPEKSKVCFLLKNGVNAKTIGNLETLKASLKERDLTDFLFWHSDGFRAYQLKTYRGKTEINEFFSYLKNKLLHYANNLGETNILFLMQSNGDFMGNFFHDIHEKIKSIGLKGTGQVLILYNEENRFNVINSVYPNLGTKRVPFDNFS